MTLYRVTLKGPPITLPGFGRTGMSWGSGDIDADGPHQAVEIARARCAESFDPRYRDVAKIEVVHEWAVTLRGRTDKRRRETFFTRATDEHEAVRQVGRKDAAIRFAGYGLFWESYRRVKGKATTTRDRRVAKVVRLTP